MRVDSRITEYRQYAAQCVEIAQTLLDADHKLALLDMAQAWLTLAEGMEGNPLSDLGIEMSPPRRRPPRLTN
jgi:hypothetical protein